MELAISGVPKTLRCNFARSKALLQMFESQRKARVTPGNTSVQFYFSAATDPALRLRAQYHSAKGALDSGAVNRESFHVEAAMALAGAYWFFVALHFDSRDLEPHQCFEAGNQFIMCVQQRHNMFHLGASRNHCCRVLTMTDRSPSSADTPRRARIIRTTRQITFKTFIDESDALYVETYKRCPQQKMNFPFSKFVT